MKRLRLFKNENFENEGQVYLIDPLVESEAYIGQQ